MLTVNLAQAKAHLSELLDKVEGGEDVIITRHGRAVAHILRPPSVKQPVPLDDLVAFRAMMPRLRRSSSDVLRAVRDNDL